MGEGMLKVAQQSFNPVDYQNMSPDVRGGLGVEALETAKKVGLVALKVLVVVAHIVAYVLGLFFGALPNDIDTFMSRRFHNPIDKQLGIE